MKKLIFTALLAVGITAGNYAQSASVANDDDDNCYLKLAKKFEERGAEEVTDGIYTDVIISVRNGSNTDCYQGKCEVKGGIIIAMFIKLEDGTFEPYKRKARHEYPITITNGMSKTLITVDDDLINVMFVKKLKPKKAEFKKAEINLEDY